jgi:hypothetical protein
MEMVLDVSKESKKRDGLIVSRPTMYICVVLAVILIAFGYRLRANTIFACQADGYTTDRYIAYCNGKSYGDYEHGAFQFDLEPKALDFAKNADVMFLGDSRLQIAFSTSATADWFSAVSARFYLMGFAYFENATFAGQLLDRMHPKARAYVINVDDFFERLETPPVKTIFHDPAARDRYEWKRRWQRVHESLCKSFTVLCGTDIVILRSRETGAYTWRTVKQKITSVSYDWAINQKVTSRDTDAAIDFLSHLGVDRKCVILTMVPYVQTKIGNAKAIAQALRLDLVTPELPEGLQTFDGFHLDRRSAERWSEAFYRAAGARIRSCLNLDPVADPQSITQ